MRKSYKVLINEDMVDLRWDEFVSQIPCGNIRQTSIWGQAKATQRWKATRIEILDFHDEILGGVQILHRPIWKGFSVGAISKGPVYVKSDNSIFLDHLFNEIVNFCKKKGIHFLSVSLPENNELLLKTAKLHDFLPALQGDIDMAADVSLDLLKSEDDILNHMSHNRRKLIRRSQERGIAFRVGKRDDFPTFYKLYRGNSERIGFKPVSEAFLDKLWDGLLLYNGLSLFLAEFEAEPISALLTLNFKEEVHAYLIGWSGEHKDRYPNDALYWGAVRWAKANGFKRFNMGGVEPEIAKACLENKPIPDGLMETYNRFKIQYNGEIVIFPNTLEYVNPPCFGFGYRFAYPILAKSSRFRKLLRKL